MKLIEKIEDQRIEEAFARKTYGSKFRPRGSVWMAVLSYGRHDESTNVEKIDASELNKLIELGLVMFQHDEEEGEAYEQAETESEATAARISADWEVQSAVIALAHAIAGLMPDDLEEHTSTYVTVVTEESLIAASAKSEDDAQLRLFKLMRANPA